VGRIKTRTEKAHLMKELKSNEPVPSWVVVKTKTKVRRTPARRHWRRTKIKMR